jgi:hypothetical protein
MRTERPPYWFWRLDRWKLLLALLLLALAALVGLRGCGAPQVAAPTFSLPVAGAQLVAGALGDTAGTATAGARVRIFDGDRLLSETVAGPDGKWRLALPALAAGAHALTAQVIGPDGKTLAVSTPLSFTVQAAPTVAPVQPTATRPPAPTAAPTTPPTTAPTTAPTAAPPTVAPTPIAVAPTFTGPAAGTALMSGALGALSGTAAPGIPVRIFDGDKLLGEAITGPDGKWSFNLPALTAGGHNLLARAVYPDGRTVDAAAPLKITVAPAEAYPIFTAPAAGSTMRAGQPLLAGRAAPYSIVRVYDGETLIGETAANADGFWSLRPTTALAPGAHSLTAVAYLGGDMPPLRSQPLAIRVEAAPTITEPVAASLPPQFTTPAAGSTVKSGQPLLRGSATPGSRIRIYDGATLLGEAVADADGVWSFRPGQALANGDHTLIAVGLDAQGQESALRSQIPLKVAVEGAGPAAPVAPVLTTALPSPLLNNRPALSGTAAAGAKVRIYDGDKLLGEVTADANGQWYFVPPAALAAGAHTLRLAVVGADGKEVFAPAVVFTIAAEANAYEPPTITAPAGGQIVAGSPLRGTAPAGSTVQVYLDGTLLGTAIADAGGKWQFTLPTALRAGRRQVRVVAITREGVALSASAVLGIQVSAPLTLPVTGGQDPD